jgi:hypothetical protein
MYVLEMRPSLIRYRCTECPRQLVKRLEAPVAAVVPAAEVVKEKRPEVRMKRVRLKDLGPAPPMPTATSFKEATRRKPKVRKRGVPMSRLGADPPS